MKEKKLSSQDNSWIIELEQKLIKQGAKHENFLGKNTYLYVPKNKEQQSKVEYGKNKDPLLRPAENTKPLVEGNDYKDYLLSDIINGDTRHLKYVSLLSRNNEAIITASLQDNSNSVFVRLMPEGGKKISVDIIPAVGRILGDAVIRYFNDSDEPYVVSLVSYNKSESIKLSDFEE